MKNLVPICLYCLNCTKFDQLILRKIIEIVATRCQILRLKCTKFNFGWGSTPDPAGGAYSAPRDPLAGFKGPTSEGREGKGRGEGEGCGGARKVVCPGARAGSWRAQSWSWVTFSKPNPTQPKISGPNPTHKSLHPTQPNPSSTLGMAY